MNRMMLTIWAGCLLALTSWASAQTTPPSAASERAVERYLRAVPMEKMLDDAYVEISKQLPPQDRAGFISDMHSIVSVKALERIARAAMIKHFTVEELNALADFYLSKHGQSAMSKFGVYMGDVQPAIIREVEAGIQELQRKRGK